LTLEIRFTVCAPEQNLGRKCFQANEVEKSSEIFTFGGGKQFSSSITVTAPCIIADIKGQFKFYALDDSAGIPPLLSKRTLIAMKGVIDAEKHTIYSKDLKRAVRLTEPESGHWVMPLNI
jgi:hypothetical protein